MARASSADLNQDFSGTGYWGRYIDHLRRTASANERYRFHRMSCLEGRSGGSKVVRHETENKAGLALGKVSRVAVVRSSVEAFRCSHQNIVEPLLLCKPPGSNRSPCGSGYYWLLGV